MSKGGPVGAYPQLPPGGGADGVWPLDTGVVVVSEGSQGEESASWGLVECRGHNALTPWVQKRTLVGSNGEVVGTDQPWRLLKRRI